MTHDQIILFALFGAVFGLLLWGRYRYDIVAFGALMLGVVLGVVDTKHAFDGFGHPATLVVALSTRNTRSTGSATRPPWWWRWCWWCRRGWCVRGQCS